MSATRTPTTGDCAGACNTLAPSHVADVDGSRVPGGQKGKPLRPVCNRVKGHSGRHRVIHAVTFATLAEW